MRCHREFSQKQLTDTENRLVVAKGEKGWEGMDCMFGISRCKLGYVGWINNQVLLCSTGNYILYPDINQEYVKLNHFAQQQKLTQYCKSTYFNKINFKKEKRFSYPPPPHSVAWPARVYCSSFLCQRCWRLTLWPQMSKQGKVHRQ